MAATDAATELPSWLSAASSISTLVWLLFMGLPSAAKQFNKMVDDKDKVIEQVQEKHGRVVQAIMDAQAASGRDARQDSKETLKMVIDHCQRENAAGMSMFLKALDEVRLAVADLRETVEGLRGKPG